MKRGCFGKPDSCSIQLPCLSGFEPRGVHGEYSSTSIWNPVNSPVTRRTIDKRTTVNIVPLGFLADVCVIFWRVSLVGLCNALMMQLHRAENLREGWVVAAFELVSEVGSSESDSSDMYNKINEGERKRGGILRPYCTGERNSRVAITYSRCRRLFSNQMHG